MGLTFFQSRCVVLTCWIQSINWQARETLLSIRFYGELLRSRRMILVVLGRSLLDSRCVADSCLDLSSSSLSSLYQSAYFPSCILFRVPLRSLWIPSLMSIPSAFLCYPLLFFPNLVSVLSFRGNPPLSNWLFCTIITLIAFSPFPLGVASRTDTFSAAFTITCHFTADRFHPYAVDI